ncbi:MAG: LON peptidase substrate-binding domain-containing protein [Longimicrobiales bacterium]
MTGAPPRRFRIPLFPLPVVLFPTAAMPLHIFEPRYRRMVARCLEYDRRFGLVYHDSDDLGPFMMEPGRVGCIAEIESFQPLPDGRSLLLARGVERFRIEDGIESDEPYYEALVTPYPDLDAALGLLQRRERSLTLFESVIETLPEEPESLPDLDLHHELSFPLVRTIQVEPTWQQAFLEIRDEAHRLGRLDRVFRAALD